MANEGFLGKHTIGGERAATSDHQVVLHYLPLSESAKAALIPVGTVLKRVEGAEGSVVWEPLLSSDETTVMPAAVVDSPCDPTGESAETSALCVVHGGVKARLLKTGDDKPLTDIQMALLMERGIFAV
ncbi:hypothetical protein [uncultured Desulfovibrio sp.]|uniref:hypothetical protein n=1 Tax=uncultured Desulfovibrio sp. TaxID=167968 RepID=UPI00262C1D1B|nr:hypothetical protein [uncultured Desulfovibrio sp.]